MLKEVKELRKVCDDKIAQKGVATYKMLNDLCEYNALELLQPEFDDERPFLLEQSLFVKKQCIANIQIKADVKFLELYFKALLSETPFSFASYIEYLEHNRPNDKKFYQPRRKTLKQVVEDLQWLEDDPKAKFYGLSLPARTGKALAYSTPVLTKDGWKLHGQLTTDDYVIGMDGEFKRVLAVHPPCKMEYRVKFADGEQIDCHGNHEWVVIDRENVNRGRQTLETKEMAGEYDRYELIPNTKNPSVNLISRIDRIDEDIIGNCITVEGGLYLVGENFKTTHNSTIAIMYLTWIMCKRPNSHSAMGGHSGILAKGFYKEVLNFISTEEYAFADMYHYMNPNSKTMIRDKSADEFTITLDKPDRFATLTCRGIDGTWTGAVDVSGTPNQGLLYVDDLVRDREHSLSPIRMENTYQEYLNKMVDRMNVGAKQLMIGTLWNVYDPLERLYQKYNGQEGYLFRRIPALDENDESNFNYEIYGFTTEYYREMREKLNDAEWQAKYQQRPYVREGLLYQSDELRYFNGILPDGDHRIVAVVDVAWGGGDSLSMPIGAEYENGDVYIFDWVFNKSTKEVTIPLVVGKIVSNEIRQMRFEGNTGGDLYCQYVDEKLREQHYKCSCTSKHAPSHMAKVEKIIAYSDDIKRKFVFLSDKRPTDEEKSQDLANGVTRYARSDEYQSAMNELCIYTTLGKNEHDDAPDGLTQLAMFIEGGNSAKIEVPRNPFRGIA